MLLIKIFLITLLAIPAFSFGQSVIEEDEDKIASYRYFEENKHLKAVCASDATHDWFQTVNIIEQCKAGDFLMLTHEKDKNMLMKTMFMRCKEDTIRIYRFDEKILSASCVKEANHKYKEFRIVDPDKYWDKYMPKSKK